MINHETLREQVCAYIRSQILYMKYKPGERIIEKDLADELGVSRGPIREALRQLEQEGLVEYRRNRGCVVQELSIADAEEVFLIRAILETTSVRCCHGKIPQENLQQMENVLGLMKGPKGTMNNYEFIELDQKFHAAIVTACGLRRLYKAWDSFTPLNLVLFLTEGRQNFVLEAQYERHRLILDTLRTGDVDAISKVISEHYLKTSAIYA